MSRLSTAPSTAANGTRRLSEAVTFVVGAAILGTQLTVGSVVASALRGSALAWAATIAVVLMSLSLGYWLGGHAADRHPDARSLSLLVLAGALALLISQPVIRPLLTVAGSSGSRWIRCSEPCAAARSSAWRSPPRALRRSSWLALAGAPSTLPMNGQGQPARAA